jgi:hypothetical protein
MEHQMLTRFALVGAVLVAGLLGATPVHAAATSKVSVVHGIAGQPVDVYVNGTKTIPNFQPATVAGPLELPAGKYDIVLTKPGDPITSPILKLDQANVPGGANISLVAHVTAGPTDLALAEGTSTIVYAIGSAQAKTLAVVAQKIEGLHSNPGGVPSGSGALPTADPTVRPTELRIAELNLTARVQPVGIDAATGDFAVPPSIDVVGWYRYGPGLEATAGSVVIAGHVDSADQGKGAFFGLRGLDRGDPVTVTGTDGRKRAYRVVAREIYTKTAIPLDRYFARDGAPRLTLITCGGPFDPKTHYYRDNVVITAEPTVG